MKRSGPYSWIIVVALLLVATSLSFLDRQVLSVSIIKIRDEINISDVGYGFVNSGFLISYALMFTLGGVLIDRYGSRLGLAVSVGFWSFATLLHSLASSAFHFGFFRFMLGLGEGGCFPGAVKAVIERVPKERHALANGIAIGGSALGAVIAPPLCAWLLLSVGWRSLFLITGGFGFMWLAAWLFFTRLRKEANSVSAITPPEIIHYEKASFLSLLRNREALTFIVIRFVLDPIFYFYMFWIPKYLNESQSLTLESIGNILWIPFLALGIGNFLGGWFSDLIFRKTSSTNKARKIVMGIAATITMPLLAVGFINSTTVIVILMALAFFAHGLWITNYITSISDIFGSRVTSTVVGLSGSAGAISALVLNPLIGLIVVNYSYNPMWWYAGLMYPVAFIILVTLIPKIESNGFSKI
ncbi:MAG: MFS transporter [Bacteroidetes bacterium]|nr:MFS transporter [Bacteroidota bacterium]